MFQPFRIFVRKHKINYKLLMVICFVISMMIVANWTNNTLEAKKCFSGRHLGSLEAGKLEDILLSKKRPTAEQSIFFHETSCSNSGEIHLTARQACAIESAARANTKFEVFVLFASPTAISNTSAKLPILNALLSYPNINLRNVNLWSYAAGTPIYEWLKDGKLFESKYVLSHASDFLRYLSLWRWGGTYLDLDVIVKKSLEEIPPNYAGAESNNYVAAGVINLDYYGFGHEIADLCLRDFQLNFDGSEWGNNGPGVITRILQTICKTKAPHLMSRDRCFGFKVFPINAFYAIHWWNWKYFFDQQYLNETLKITDNSIAIHVWNKNSANGVIKVGTKAAYGVLAEKFCPRVYNSCGKFF